jgi:hypothetical protein
MSLTLVGCSVSSITLTNYTHTHRHSQTLITPPLLGHVCPPPPDNCEKKCASQSQVWQGFYSKDPNRCDKSCKCSACPKRSPTAQVLQSHFRLSFRFCPVLFSFRNRYPIVIAHHRILPFSPFLSINNSGMLQDLRISRIVGRAENKCDPAQGVYVLRVQRSCA